MKQIEVNKQNIPVSVRKKFDTNKNYTSVTVTRGVWWDERNNQIVIHFNEDGYWTGDNSLLNEQSPEEVVNWANKVLN